jgi:hypothetical protein
VPLSDKVTGNDPVGIERLKVGAWKADRARMFSTDGQARKSREQAALASLEKLAMPGEYLADYGGGRACID